MIRYYYYPAAPWSNFALGTVAFVHQKFYDILAYCITPETAKLRQPNMS